MKSPATSERNKVRQYIKKLEKLNSAQKKLILSVFVMFFIVLIGIAIILNFRSKFISNRNFLLIETGEIQNIDIILSKKGFEPNKVELLSQKDYNFRIIKIDETQCDSLKNLQLDYSISIPNVADKFVIRLPQSGDYTLQCSNSSEMKIEITSK